MEKEEKIRKRILNSIHSHTVVRAQISIEALSGHEIKKIILNGDGTFFGFVCTCTEHRRTVHHWDKKKKMIIY